MFSSCLLSSSIEDANGLIERGDRSNVRGGLFSLAEEEEKRKTPRPLNNSLDEEFFKKLLASINTLFFFFFFSPTRVNSFLLTRCSTRCLLKPLNVSKFHALLNDPLNYHRKFDEKNKMKKKKKKKGEKRERKKEPNTTLQPCKIIFDKSYLLAGKLAAIKNN